MRLSCLSNFPLLGLYLLGFFCLPPLPRINPVGFDHVSGFFYDGKLLLCVW